MLHSVRTRILAGFAALILLQAGVAVAVWLADRRVDEAAAASAIAEQNLAAVFEIRAGVFLAKISLGAYARTGNAEDRSSMEKAIAGLTDMVNAQADSNSDKARLTSSVGDIRTALGTVFTASVARRNSQAALALTGLEAENALAALAQAATKAPNRAVEDAKRTDRIVVKLSQGAEKIGSVVSLISDIASQTNLLALNATIEAARAGDAGKGFAVVASEVKNLAKQTARATQDISAEIAEVQAATTEAVSAIGAILRTIEDVSAIASTIAAAVEQQGAATSEIARNVQQTAQSTQEVTHHIGGVSQAANDTGTAAGQVLHAAGDLSRQAEELNTEVGRFITDVRAA